MITHEYPTQDNIEKPKKKKSFFFIFKIAILLVVIIFLAISFEIKTSGQDGESFFVQLKHLITSGDKPIKGEGEDRINILLLGNGGEGHEGPYLTDTIIVASFRPSDKRVAFLSVPRDLLVDFPEYGKRKINHVYALSEADNEGSGGMQASAVIENVFDMPIHYYVQIDFQGFEKIIDDIGGVTINVENTLDDEFYPVEGQDPTSDIYEHLLIEKGIRHMNGQTALKYARSRKAKGIEGSDFARSKRQQKVLLAVKEKVLSFGTLFNPNRIIKVTRTLKGHISTNFVSWEMFRMYNIAKDVNTSDIRSFILDDGPESPLRAVASEDLYFLTPKSGDNSELQNIALHMLDDEYHIESKITNIIPLPEEIEKNKPEDVPILPEITKKEALIEIHNGTSINGLASRVSSFLESKGYTIINAKNAPLQTYKKTLIYDLKPKRYEEVIETLNEFFDAIVFSSGRPEKITDEDGQEFEYPIDSASHILIILGEDQNGKY